MWPVGVVGAITHSDRYAAASIAGANRLNGIGIDIESAIGEETVTVIEEEILSPSELAVLRQTGVLPYIMLLTLAFSAKESFYKALFPTVNRYFGFETICLSQIDTSHGRIRFYLRQTLAPAWPAGRAFFVDFALLSPSEVLTAFAW